MELTKRELELIAQGLEYLAECVISENDMPDELEEVRSLLERVKNQ